MDAPAGEILESEFANLDHQAARQSHCLQFIAREISAEPHMIRCMKVLGIGLVSAFALLTVVGETGRFDPGKALREELGLPETIDDSVIHFQNLLTGRKIDYALKFG